ncbi:glycerate kinase-like [Tubulanus polymorphus]|uniref:glycerate kinase-like n=1 Tax=Tubulanus polymorphus TaxID=672921 RepID=UPI003DA28057
MNWSLLFCNRTSSNVLLTKLKRIQRFSSHTSIRAIMSSTTTIIDGNSGGIKSKIVENHLQNKLKKDAKNIFERAVYHVQPKDMVDKALHREGDSLFVEGYEYELRKNVYVVGYGKAVLGMIRATENVLGDHIAKGVASIPVGLQDAFKLYGKSEFLLKENTKIQIYEGAESNLPDQNAYEASMHIHRLCQSLSEKDLLIVLMSGGGSALLPAPIPPITLEEKAIVTRLMSTNGATIQEINTVRKNLSLLKGGGLAEVAAPAQVISLMLSDIIGDPMDMIASGPTVSDTTTAQQCLDLFRKFGIENQVPVSVLKFLRKRALEDDRRLLRIQREGYDQISGVNTAVSTSKHDCRNVRNIIVGSNKMAVKSAVNYAQQLGYFSVTLTSKMSGEASKVGILLSRLAKFVVLCRSNKRDDGNRELIKSEMDLLKVGMSKQTINRISCAVAEAISCNQPLCIVAGGETTVTVGGNGKGGRNQELALSAVIEMNEMFTEQSTLDNFSVQLLSAGTDGQDGPTEAAGAFAAPHVYSCSREAGLVPEKFLKENDSYNFFARVNDGKDHYIIDHTGTNVMDLQILLISPNDFRKK